MRFVRSPIASLIVAGLAVPVVADVVTLVPAQDNTLYEAPDGAYSSGTGEFFFAGQTNQGLVRRAVIAFDLSGIPAGSTITAVTLRLRMSRTTAGNQTMNLHRVTSSWGEGISVSPGNGGFGGPSEPNDATWIHRFYPNTLWTTEGGDYVATSSGSRAVAGINFYTWGSTPQMVADAQSWLDTPAQNFGWILIGNETPNRTAKRFDSRENVVPGNRPLLTVTFTPPVPACDADANDNGTLEPADVAVFVNMWAASLAAGDLTGDFDGNGVVSAADVAAFVSTWTAELENGC